MAKLFGVLLLLVVFGMELVLVPALWGVDVGDVGELRRMVTVTGPSLVWVDTDPGVCVSLVLDDGPEGELLLSGLLLVL